MVFDNRLAVVAREATFIQQRDVKKVVTNDNRWVFWWK